MRDTRFVLTGASGVIGGRLASILQGPRHDVALSAPDWRRRIDETPFADSVVLHLAARAHRGGTDEQFRRDNVEKTRALAHAAAAGGARRLVFLSSIKVNGEATTTHAFTPFDAPAPEDAYGRSKRDAESALADVASSSGLPIVIVRCPLVYGAPVKGHLRTLLRACDSAVPLPFARVRNRRSFIALDDLCRALVRCAVAEQAAGKTYLVAHREPVSTPQLITAVRLALGRRPRLFAVEPRILELVAAAAGMSDMMKRLTRSLETDPSLAELELDWRAEVSIEQAVLGMVGACRA